MVILICIFSWIFHAICTCFDSYSSYYTYNKYFSCPCVYIFISVCVWPVALNIRVGIHPGGGYWFAANLSPNVSLPFLQLFHHFDCWRLFVSIVMISIFLLTLVCNM